MIQARLAPMKFRQIWRMSTSKLNAQFEVVDTKNSHLLYVKDPQAKLPYMSEIITTDGQRGVVIKLQEQAISVIGMYSNGDKTDKIHIAEVNDGKQIIKESKVTANKIYDIELKIVGQVKDVQPKRAMTCEIKHESKRIRLPTLSPILSVCHDLAIGDFISFTGPLGSGRTTNALNILQCFTNSNIQQPIGIYLNTNPNDYKQTCTKAASQLHTLSFGRTISVIQSQQAKKSALSSVGVYMLAVKCIKIAKKLKQQGKNVMLVVDNIQQILANEWTILQNLNLPISPFAILNQLYSIPQEGKPTRAGKKKIEGLKGSLTTIAISNPENQDVIQEYTTFGNNSKYLKTLSSPIPHPLQLTANNNKIIQDKLLAYMRKKVNRYVKEKRQTDLLARLKLTQDQPWEHYFLLDAQWWVSALRKFRPQSLGDRDLLLWFINANIQEDFCAHWKIDCIEAYNRYLDYLARPEDPRQGMDAQQFQNFIQICKSEKVFDLFKKDYLN